MIVYGSRLSSGTVGEWTRLLGARVERLRARPALGGLRDFAVLAGELEQGVEDREPGSGLSLLARGLTDEASRAFCRVWGGRESERAGAHLARAADVVARLEPSSSVPVSVVTPEGFAHYALYPEGHAAAALRWAREHPGSGQVLVVGLRSIGTTLSAVVAAALELEGVSVRRATVRPGGHPFDREVRLAEGAVAGASSALVVDEGPGLSGSSMAAAAEALTAAGVPRTGLAFLPGHAGPPGPCGSARVRAWWDATPKYVGEGPPPEALGRGLAAVAGLGPPRDLGGGAWRSVAGAWAALAPCWPRFESPKYLWRREGRGVFAKFAGFARGPAGRATRSEEALSELEFLHGQGWGPEPLGAENGFVAYRWVEGSPCTRAERGPETAARIGRYLAVGARRELSAAQIEEGFGRLAGMLEVNAREALGDDAGRRAAAGAARAWDASGGGGCPEAADAHLAPHEWIRDRQGRAWKVDAFGHADDHTVAGAQPLAWGAAAARVEWGLRPPERAGLAAALAAAGLPVAPAPLQEFYDMAFAALRMGMSRLCLEDRCGPGEGRLLRQAYSRYRRRLAAGLARVRP